jgi:hypothetical protein
MPMLVCRKPASKSTRDKDRGYIHEVLFTGKRQEDAISVMDELVDVRSSLAETNSRGSNWGGGIGVKSRAFSRRYQ